ncbi:unnamed protein product [Phaedon cochleariae]|uniref:Uncharacterized protein n=1 Tax=Phaedon cochleariae TaxID=80249 RepID=A0A9N9SI04_PHACE|nr:unnamed protein product [Phaedon cochleariae]
MSIDGHNVKIIQTIRGHTSDVTCCDFAPNFTLITGSSDKTVRIWDWTGGRGYTERSCSPLRAHKYQVTCVRASPQGSMLASASVDGTAVVWSVATCARLYTMTQVNGDAVRVCRFSPDSAILVTAGDNGAICIWDLVHRSLIKTIFDHEGTTQALAFTPDSQYLVTACSLEVVRVWLVRDLVDTAADALCCPLARVDNVQDMGVLSVDVSRRITFDENDPLIRKYNLATSGNTNEIRLWTITTKSLLKQKTACASSTNEVLVEPFDVYDGHASTVTSVRFSHSGAYLISTSLDKLVKVWDEQGNCVASLQGHDRYVNCAAISRDATLLVSGSNDKQVIVWDLKGNLTLDSELNHFRTISAFADGVSENQMAENVDPNGNKVTLLEKLDDVAEGTINSCSFYGNSLLATGSG